MAYAITNSMESMLIFKAFLQQFPGVLTPAETMDFAEYLTTGLQEDADAVKDANSENRVILTDAEPETTNEGFEIDNPEEITMEEVLGGATADDYSEVPSENEFYEQLAEELNEEPVQGQDAPASSTPFLDSDPRLSEIPSIPITRTMEDGFTVQMAVAKIDDEHIVLMPFATAEYLLKALKDFEEKLNELQVPA